MKYVVYACNKRGQANYLGAANIQMEMYQLSAAGYLFVQAGFGSLFNCSSINHSLNNFIALPWGPSIVTPFTQLQCLLALVLGIINMKNCLCQLVDLDLSS